MSSASHPMVLKMDDHPKIAVLIPYFGSWPEWFPLFLRTCRYNTEIDWILPSDLKIKEERPPNVKLVYVKLEELSQRISKMLDLEIQITHPYKLTDFKPAYGYIFSDLLSEYEFWGYGDMDLVYGKIGQFLSSSVFTRFDVISPSRDFFPGHFLMLRNTETICNLFRRASNWKNILSDELCHSFDEKYNGTGIRPDPETIRIEVFRKIEAHLLEYKTERNQLLSALNRIIGCQRRKLKYIRSDLNDFNSILNLAAKKGEIKVFQKQLYCDDVIYKRDMLRGKLYWNKGILTLRGKEIMYYHFQILKYGWPSFDEKADDSFELNLVSPEKPSDLPDDNKRDGSPGKRTE